MVYPEVADGETRRYCRLSYRYGRLRMDLVHRSRLEDRRVRLLGPEGQEGRRSQVGAAVGSY